MVSLVSKKYSEALYLVGIERNNLNVLIKEADELGEVFKLNPDISKALCHPQVPFENKVKMVKEMFEGKVSKEMYGLLIVVLKKSRQQFLEEIFEAFVNRCKVHDNISTAVVITAEKLKDEMIDKIKTKLEGKMSKKIEIEERIDDRLIGGLKIVVDNLLFDNSIDGKFKNMNRAIS